MKKELQEIKELLIVVDMVNGFIKEGALANKDAMHIVPKQIELIEKFLKRKQGILFIKDTHTENSIEFQSFPPHCIKGSSEANLIDEFLKYEKDGLSIEKNSTSFIFAEGFLKLIDEMKNLKRVIGVGVCSDICIPNGFIPLKNYFNQNNKDIEIIVPIDSVETFNSPNHNRDEYTKASNILMAQSGIKLIKTIKDIEWRD